jgi:hypothetical protein
VPVDRKSGCAKAFTARANAARAVTDRHAAEGKVTWKDILLEEVWEALAEVDYLKQRAELIQVIAVGVSWIEDSDRKYCGQ